MSFQDEVDVFSGGGAKFLSPSRAAPRRTPSWQNIKGRKSSISLRGGSSLAQALDGDGGHGMHSLAHELAFALMPEPSAGSKMLQEEFGIEYDEGAEGIDDQPALVNGNSESLAMQLNGNVIDDKQSEEPNLSMDAPVEDLTSHFGSNGLTPIRQAKQQAVQDPMDILSKDLESTDKFLSQLRQLDADAGPSSSQLSVEKIASDMIRHINDTVRDREGQVRELLEYEREFRKIAGDVNGNDVLGHLDALEEVEGLTDGPSSTDLPSRSVAKPDEISRRSTRMHERDVSNDWERDPYEDRLGDDEILEEEPESPSVLKDSFIQPPQLTGPPTVAKTLPEIGHVRTLTASLASSLTAISEHAQVNGAANADAGRKIRALKNKLGGWRSEWDSAERSRIKIERWEAGLPDDDSTTILGSPPRPGGSRRVDGRRIVEEHLRAFETALADAGAKTQAIMARP